MQKKFIIVMFFLLSLSVCLIPSVVGAVDDVNWGDDLADYDEPGIQISDPLESLNRIFFQFNDKFYFLLLKPVSRTWSFIVPQELRASIWSAFRNVLMPVRVVNDLLQGRFRDSGVEISRFLINSTVGVVGLGDPAKYVFKLESSEEDLGQTLGYYGIGEGIYICWPFLGPSNMRDTVGLVGDAYFDPFRYMISDGEAVVAIHAARWMNYTSLNIGDYEQFKDASFDPYVAMREYYTKNRRKKINNRIHNGGGASYVIGENAALLEQQDTQQYYVQVGVFFDLDSMGDFSNKLVSMGRQTVVATHKRDDYAFYGLEVPAGTSAEEAHQVEQKLVLGGFAEAKVLRHASL